MKQSFSTMCLAGLWVACGVALGERPAPSTQPSQEFFVGPIGGKHEQAAQPSTQPATEFYVAGEVKRPGVYVLEPDSTLLKAVDGAGGTTGASDYQVLLTRVIVPHQLEQVTTFNSLNALQGVPASDIALRPGDMVMILAVKP